MAFESKRLLKPPPPVPVRTIVAKDEETQRIQQNLVDATAKTRALPAVKGRVVTIEPTAAGDFTFSHGLGRKPSGYKAVRQNAAADHYLVSMTSRLMTLNISAPVKLAIEVY